LAVPPIVRTVRATLLLLLFAIPLAAHARTLRVGPERNYRTLRDAAMLAGDGDVILVDAGTYTADVATWSQNDLVLWAPEGRARIVAQDAAKDQKGIWVVEGRNFTAENIEFEGARASGHSGAGIRIHAKGKVTLRSCYFHDNENGVVGDAEEILIDKCVFDHNGAGDGQSHNIDVWGPKVTIRNSYIHRSVAGHNVKTRGETSYILANRIMDEADGTGSTAIDVPDCGRTYIIGNVIEQGPESHSYHLISYGAESRKSEPELYVVNNTLVNDGRKDGFFLKIRKGAHARITNNIFYGPGTTWVGGEVEESHNEVIPALDNEARFANPRGYDFRLTVDSPRSIVDRGISPGTSASGYDLTPNLEYVYDAWGKERPVSGPLDLGAFESTAVRAAATVPPVVERKVVSKRTHAPAKERPAKRSTSSRRKGGKRTI
jgi:hypothetical protein